MPWLQLHLPVAKADAEQLENALDELGAAAVTLTDAADEPLFEPPPGATPLWQETVISALFDPSLDADELLASVRAFSGLALVEYKAELLADQVWERAWMNDFKPMRFGERLWIVPSNCAPEDDQAINLKLDPGLAFGTGTHETTALCLNWIDAARLDGKQVLDFGCGSGILAIAALLCGAKDAVGTDIDPQALLASADNAANNGVDDRLALYLPEDLPKTQVDVLLANILATPLIELCAHLASLCRPGADLVLSGILANQADAVLDAYAPWFDMQPPVQRGDWVRLTGSRKS